MRVQGSYTLESELVVRIVLGFILLILSQTIYLYIEVTETTKYDRWWEEFQPAESFRKIEFLREFEHNSGEE